MPKPPKKPRPSIGSKNSSSKPTKPRKPPNSITPQLAEKQTKSKAAPSPTASRIAKRLQNSQGSKSVTRNRTRSSKDQFQNILLQKQKAWVAAGWLTRKGLPPLKTLQKGIIQTYRERNKEFEPEKVLSDEEVLKRHAARQKQRTSSSGFLTGESEYYLPEDFWNFLEDFVNDKGFNATFMAYIEGLLRGKVAPFIDCTRIYRQYLDFHSQLQKAKTKKKEIRKLLRSYQSLDCRIQLDPSFSSAFQSAWIIEYAATCLALEELRKRASDELEELQGKPPHCTVGFDKPFSRQGFWTPIILSLVKEGEDITLTQYQSFKFIANLLSKAFPTLGSKKPTFDSALVKRRFYHGKKANAS